MTPTQLETLWHKVLKKQGVIVRLSEDEYQSAYKAWDEANDPLFCLTPPSRFKLVGHQRIPDITLDTLRELVEMLQGEQRVNYVNALFAMFDEGQGWDGSSTRLVFFPLVNASAEHRLLALARTLGIKDGE